MIEIIPFEGASKISTNRKMPLLNGAGLLYSYVMSVLRMRLESFGHWKQLALARRGINRFLDVTP